jgi:hypothetical protein
MHFLKFRQNHRFSLHFIVFSPHFGQSEKQECPFFSGCGGDDRGDIAAFDNFWFGEFFGGSKII